MWQPIIKHMICLQTKSIAIPKYFPVKEQVLKKEEIIIKKFVQKIGGCRREDELKNGEGGRKKDKRKKEIELKNEEHKSEELNMEEERKNMGECRRRIGLKQIKKFVGCIKTKMVRRKRKTNQLKLRVTSLVSKGRQNITTQRERKENHLNPSKKMKPKPTKQNNTSDGRENADPTNSRKKRKLESTRNKNHVSDTSCRSPPTKKTRLNYPKEVTDKLLAEISLDNLYPSKEVKMKLVGRTGKSLKQINDFYTNFRRRKKALIQRGEDPKKYKRLRRMNPSESGPSTL